MAMMLKKTLRHKRPDNDMTATNMTLTNNNHLNNNMTNKQQQTNHHNTNNPPRDKQLATKDGPIVNRVLESHGVVFKTNDFVSI